MQKRNGLLLLDATATIAVDQPLPKRMVIFPWGSHATQKFGVLTANEKTVRALPVIQPALRRDFIHGDFNHNSLPASPSYKGEPIKLSARRATVSCVPGEGIVADDIEWMPLAEEHKRDYPEISPGVICDDAGTIIGIDSFALCRHGQVGPGLALPLSAETAAAIQQEQQLPVTNNEEGEDDMDYKKLLLIILSLPDTAEDKDIQDAATKAADKLKVAPAAAADRIAAVAPPTEKKTEPPTVTPLSAESVGKVVTDAIAPVAGRLDAIERQNITALAIRDGKIIPLHADKLGIADFKALVDSLPANQVPMDQRTPDKVKALASSGMAPLSGDTSVDANVCAQLNITKEQYDAAK